MKRRIFTISICFVIILSLLCTSVFGFELNTPYSFSYFKFKAIDTYEHQLSGTYVLIDSQEFLALVTQAILWNSSFLQWTNDAPINTYNAIFSRSTSQDFLVIAMKLGAFWFKQEVIDNPPNHSVFINGIELNPSQHNSFTLQTYHFPYDDYIVVDNVLNYSSGSQQQYVIAQNDAQHVIAFDPQTNPIMISILHRLEDIQAIASLISYNTSSGNTLLNSIISNISTTNNTLSDINTKLTSIYNSLIVTNNILNQLLQYDSLFHDQFTDIYDGILDFYNDFLIEISTVENDLESIDTHLINFRSNFGQYAASALSYFQSMDSHLDNIDGTLSDIWDEMNGEALKDVNVPGSSSPNLWQLIKTSISTGISGIAQFFNLIFGNLSDFSTSANNGYSYLGNIDSYTGIAYDPLNLSGYTSVTLLPYSETYINSNECVWNAQADGTIYYTCTGNGTNSYSVFHVKTLQANFVLSPGTYRIYGPNTGHVYVYVNKQVNGVSTNIAFTSTGSASFTLNASTQITMGYQIRGNIREYGHFTPCFERLE